MKLKMISISMGRVNTVERDQKGSCCNGALSVYILEKESRQVVIYNW